MDFLDFDPLAVRGMPVRTEITFDGQCLIVLAEGAVSVDAMVEMLTHAFDSAKERSAMGLLVNMLAVSRTLSTMERHVISSEVAAYALHRNLNLRIALVGKPPVLVRFDGVVLQNRGLTAELFESQEAAQSWLNTRG